VCGQAADPHHFIKWDLRFEDPCVSSRVHPLHGLFPFMNPVWTALSPRLKAFASGRIYVDHRGYDANHIVVSQHHFFGRKIPKLWAWHAAPFWNDSVTAAEILLTQGLWPFHKNPVRHALLVIDDDAISTSAWQSHVKSRHDASNGNHHVGYSQKKKTIDYEWSWTQKPHALLINQKKKSWLDVYLGVKSQAVIAEAGFPPKKHTAPFGLALKHRLST
jgi:hypothetical protein